MNFRVSSATTFHRKRSKRFFPFCKSSSKSVSDNACTSPLVISDTSFGLTKTAPSPPTSTRLELFDVKTGVPHAQDSTTGSPKPSYFDGNAVRCAKLYKIRSSSSVTKFVQMTLPSASDSFASFIKPSTASCDSLQTMTN